jgi:hypothetical protein
MRTKNEAEKIIKTATKVADLFPDNMTDTERSYILGIIDGMNAFKSMHRDAPEKTA